MNTLFLDPLQRSALPEVVDDTLDDGAGNQQTSCAMNRNGTLLAIGTHEGRTNIWDFYTRTICKVLVGHVRPVTSQSWSHTGRYLATTSLDGNLRVWDVVTTTFALSKQFDTMVLKCEWHPSNPDLILVVLWMTKHPIILNFKTGEETEVKAVISGEDGTREEVECDYSMATWNFTGSKIYKGTNRGLVTVVDTDTMEVESSFQIEQDNVSVKGFSFSKDENQFLINCTDSTIRVYSTYDNSLLFDLTNPVERVQWKKVVFFGEDYISAFSSQTASHMIYIWSRSSGQLIKMMEGPKDLYHPTRSVLVTCTATGIAYVWTKPHSENWSAYAPNFTELEENEEYLEREDEFDEPDTEEEEKKKEEAKTAREILEATEIDIGDEEEYNDNINDTETDVEFLLTTHPIPDYLILAATDQRPVAPKKRQLAGGREGKSEKRRK